MKILYNNHKLNEEHLILINYFCDVMKFKYDTECISINNYSENLLIITTSEDIGYTRYIFDLADYILYEVDFDFFVDHKDLILKYDKNEIYDLQKNMKICNIFMNYQPFVEWERKVKIEKVLGILNT